MDDLRKKNQYSLYQRKRKSSKPVFYARFRNADGSWSSGISTGQIHKGSARGWCETHLKEIEFERKRADEKARATRIAEEKRKKEITFRDFSKGFFEWGGPWCIDKQASGKRITPRQCKEKTAILDKRVLPLIGNQLLSEINKSTLREFRNTLFKQGLAGSSINKAISCIKVAMDAAEEKDLIPEAPQVVRAGIAQKERGILAIAEVRELFSAQWPDFRAYCFNLLQASTGMRRGECLALFIEDVAENYIEIKKSWDETQRSMNPTTKTGRSRVVILPAFVRHEIHRLIDIHPYRDNPGAFLFFSSREDKPMEGNYALKILYKMLKIIGIDEKQRQERQIVGHSWRHWYNSILVNNKIPLMKVQQLTGHSTVEMTRQYFHADDMQDVLEVVEGAFDQKGRG